MWALIALNPDSYDDIAVRSFHTERAADHYAYQLNREFDGYITVLVAPLGAIHMDSFLQHMRAKREIDETVKPRTP